MTRGRFVTASRGEYPSMRRMEGRTSDIVGSPPFLGGSTSTQPGARVLELPRVHFEQGQLERGIDGFILDARRCGALMGGDQSLTSLRMSTSPSKKPTTNSRETSPSAGIVLLGRGANALKPSESRVDIPDLAQRVGSRDRIGDPGELGRGSRPRRGNDRRFAFIQRGEGQDQRQRIELRAEISGSEQVEGSNEALVAVLETREDSRMPFRGIGIGIGTNRASSLEPPTSIVLDVFEHPAAHSRDRG